MASSNRRLRTTSEILECLDNLPSEGDPIDLLDDEENENVRSIEAAMDIVDSSDCESVVNDTATTIEERLFDPEPDLQDSAEFDEDCENNGCDWEEFNDNIHNLRKHPFTGKQQFIPHDNAIRTPLDFFHLFFSLE